MRCHSLGRQKYRSVQREPRIALSIVDQDTPLRYCEVWGVVDLIELDPDNAFINHIAS